MRAAVRRRAARLRPALKRLGADALLATDAVAVGYLSGFTGEDSWLLVGKGKGCLLTDSRFTEQARADCPSLTVTVRKGPLIEALARVVRGKRVRRLGFDPEAVSVALLGRLRKGLKGVRLVPAPKVVADLRLRKDETEIAAIRRAVAVAEEAWAGFRKAIRLGMTEQRLAAELDHRMRLAGADGPSFPTIMAVDASAARPHAIPGRRRLRRGSVLLVDFGARVGGYVCDLTRVVFAGRIAPFVRKVYGIVHAAQAAGIAAVRPGVALTAVDAAVRGVIADAGFGHLFGHGTGHG
ncbi:MAG: aminopeptidase P family protein, partial [Planctomycetes bacterium]|nr:aminopeptidase P family protein [Planctomycetota bacterium]